MKTITRKAYGKVNLALDVVRRLENGYHEVRMIMQQVALHDVVTLSPLAGGNVEIHTGSEKIPCDEHNLACRAVRAMEKALGRELGVAITIEKNIPVAAGMAGGSTDCAAVLLGVNEMYELGLTTEQLCEIGVTIGADVPYCVRGGTCLSEGIGEVLTELAPPPACFVLLAKPDIDVSTAYVYQHLDVKSLAENPALHPDIDGMAKALGEGDLPGICSRMSNVLESVTGAEYPVIGEIEACMLDAGAVSSVMSGSGPTVFGIFTDRAEAEKGEKLIREKGLAKEVFVSTFLGER